jgi:two-component system, chemotaxis family, chemotaxis protein CheY
MKHCLVVGDSRVIRKVACQLLEEMKIFAEEVEESSSALDACRQQMPDAVLVDLSHAGSIEFMRQLRRDKTGKQPQIVFTTTENNVTQITEALNAGADAYFFKPFDRQTMQQSFAPLAMAA